MTLPRVIMATGVLSPFQIDVADAMREINLIDYHVCFTKHSAERRGKHWNVELSGRSHVHCVPSGGTAEAFLRQTLDEIQPQVILCGAYRGPLLREVIQYRHRHRCKVGLWGEQLHPSAPPKSWVKRAIKHFNLRDVDFGLAIGDRALRQFASVIGVCKTHLIPYGQDLSHHFAIDRHPCANEGKIRFLFSGRLVAQHNLRPLFHALAELARRRPGSFTLTIAASGPEQKHLDRAIRRNPALGHALRYDRDYSCWEDRVRPFADSDVLLYPSHHAGWGLVVPEAMAAGMLVLASRGVVSARYLITPGVDGLMIGKDKHSITTAIEWCIDHPRAVREMGLAARRAAQRGTAQTVARDLSTVLGRYLNLQGPSAVTS